MTEILKTIEQSDSEPGWSQCCSYYEKRIREEKNEITKCGLRAALCRRRLEQLEISLDECRQNESPTEVPDELRSDEVVNFWKDKLLTDYRNNAGYIGGIAADLCTSGLTESQLRHLSAELVSLVCSEIQENLKVIGVMKNRDGFLTTPGHTEDSLYYLICKRRGIDLDTKSVKERPAVIRDELGKWDVDNAFQESNRIMRHWAQLEHARRVTAGKKTQPAVTTAGKDEIRAEYQPGESIPKLMERLSATRWNLPDKRTVERYTKDLRQSKRHKAKK